MAASERTNRPDGREREWREVLVEVEEARSEYAKYAQASDEDEEAAGRRWLRLWRAERRRDDLVRTLDEELHRTETERPSI
jgi:hypothetical protein